MIILKNRLSLAGAKQSKIKGIPLFLTFYPFAYKYTLSSKTDSRKLPSGQKNINIYIRRAGDVFYIGVETFLAPVSRSGNPRQVYRKPGIKDSKALVPDRPANLAG